MMNKVLKAMTLMLVSSLVVSSLVGCGKTTNSSSSATSTTGKTVEVTFMTWESKEMNDKIVESMKDFESSNPGITVKLIPSPIGDYGLKLNQMIAANSAPDIFEAGQDTALQMSTKGQGFDYTSYLNKDTDLANGFYPGVMDNWKLNGKVTGLPGLLNCYGVFYNKAFFKKAGIAEPKQGWTYQEMFDDAQKLSSNSGGVKVYGLYNHAMDPFAIGVYAASFGGAPFTDSMTKATKVEISDKFKEGVITTQKYVKSGAVAPPTYKVDNIMGLFEQGKVPMLEYGQWGADELIRNAPKDLEWAYVPNPKGDIQSTIFDSVGWASPSTIKNPDAVFKVLKYLDTKMYEKVLPATPVAPAAAMASAQPYYDKLKAAGHSDVADTLDYMLKCTNKQPIRFTEVWSGDANKFSGSVWNNIIESKTDISAVDKMASDINNVINSNK